MERMRSLSAGLATLHLLLLAACAACGPEREDWQILFDGRGLGDFAVTKFGGEGAVRVEGGRLLLEQGGPLTGVTWRGAALPGSDYELELSAARLLGTDFFCGLTFPVGESHASLILGGWGGALCGLSSLDGSDASENETQSFRGFEMGRVYRVRVEVTAARIRAFVDDECIVDAAIAGRQVDTRPEVELSKPLGIASFMTTAAIGPVRWRRLGATTISAAR